MFLTDVVNHRALEEQSAHFFLCVVFSSKTLIWGKLSFTRMGKYGVIIYSMTAFFISLCFVYIVRKLYLCFLHVWMSFNITETFYMFQNAFILVLREYVNTISSFLIILFARTFSSLIHTQMLSLLKTIRNLNMYKEIWISRFSMLK